MSKLGSTFAVPLLYPNGMAGFWANQETLGNLGSPGRTRTSDPAVNSRLLYQLSYRGAERAS